MNASHATYLALLTPPPFCTPFVDPYIFKITFECISELQEDIEWKLIYVGSAEDEKYDQELDNCLVGPVPIGESPYAGAKPVETCNACNEC